jgi:[phosphatase 2A protein]-leucine-carboxy methyltransferase
MQTSTTDVYFLRRYFFLSLSLSFHILRSYLKCSSDFVKMNRTTLDNSNIIETNNDACLCKLYAIERGYWMDPYLKLFAGAGHLDRRTPEISIGYYVRVHGLRYLIEKFIRLTNNRCQIINLGCGFDTTVFYLLDNDSLRFHHFLDIDFDEITETKAYKIRRSSILNRYFSSDNSSLKIPCGFHSSMYTILPVDLRDTAQLDSQLKRLHQHGIIDFDRPTLCLTECVLIYMSNEHSLNLLSYLSSTFASCCLFVNFEQINMNDRFGQIMCDNLKQRSCHLIGMNSCQSKTSQCERYIQANLPYTHCITLNEFYENYLNRCERQRIESIDGGLDEKELLKQLFEHYCFSWASRDEKNIGLNSIQFE